MTRRFSEYAVSVLTPSAVMLCHSPAQRVSYVKSSSWTIPKMSTCKQDDLVSAWTILLQCHAPALRNTD